MLFYSTLIYSILFYSFVFQTYSEPMGKVKQWQAGSKLVPGVVY